VQTKNILTSLPLQPLNILVLEQSRAEQWIQTCKHMDFLLHIPLVIVITIMIIIIIVIIIRLRIRGAAQRFLKHIIRHITITPMLVAKPPHVRT
jgi:hypothetical protein